jgi:hypothetical protein
MQSYFTEAVEKYEVKIYELQMICGDFTKTFYFCCRVEIGIESVYYDANWNSLNSS